MYKKIQGCTRRYEEVQEDIKMYKKIQGCTRRYEEVQEDIKMYKKIRGGTRRYKDVQEDTRMYKEIQVDIKFADVIRMVLHSSLAIVRVKHFGRRVKQGIANKFTTDDCHLNIIILILLIMITTSIISLIVLHEKVSNYSVEETAYENDLKKSECPCNDVLDYGTKGQWIASKSESIGLSDAELRVKLGISPEMHRGDTRYVLLY
eukprot:gene12740-14045_t